MLQVPLGVKSGSVTPNDRTNLMRKSFETAPFESVTLSTVGNNTYECCPGLRRENSERLRCCNLLPLPPRDLRKKVSNPLHSAVTFVKCSCKKNSPVQRMRSQNVILVAKEEARLAFAQISIRFLVEVEMCLAQTQNFPQHSMGKRHCNILMVNNAVWIDITRVTLL